VVRRRLTLKRIDPWSVLKFGFVANLSLLAIGLLGAGVIWFFVQRLQLIAKVCEIATEMGFVACGVNGGNLFRALFLLGLLGVVIQTGLVVFLAFLYNLIADLVGGLSFSFVDDTPGAAARGDLADGRPAGTVTSDAAPRRTPVGASTAPRREEAPRPTPGSGAVPGRGSTGNPGTNRASAPPGSGTPDRSQTSRVERASDTAPPGDRRWNGPASP
jgi:hypothetical protein